MSESENSVTDLFMQLIGFVAVEESSRIKSRNLPKPSIMVRRFLNISDTSPPLVNLDLRFRPMYFFFYGSHMDPIQLKNVLQLDHQHSTTPATIVQGYTYKLWGQYPALLDGLPGATVKGVSYYVQTQEEKDRLEAYETKNYVTVGCLIELEDRTKVYGLTFKWASDTSLLRDGTFSLREWQFGRFEQGR
jgi:gamma-glutamylcyclotransferase (GGCT)/AIG2-like uncharacterized protein YtfP